MQIETLSVLKRYAPKAAMRCGLIAFAMLTAVASNEAQDKPPRIFLDKSPRIVAYQLKRLDNARLLMVERDITDPKFAPVYRAILIRAGMSPDEQFKAAEALAAINETSVVKEVLKGIAGLEPDSRQDRLTASKLTEIVLQGVAEASLEDLSSAIQNGNGLSQISGFAGLLALGKTDLASKLASDAGRTSSWLRAVPLVPDVDRRNELRDSILEFVGSGDPEIQREAILSLKSVTKARSETFVTIAKRFGQDAIRSPVVELLLTIPKKDRQSETSASLVGQLVAFAESTPASDRTSVDFTNAMQLADRLLGDLPIATAKQFRARLRETTVRVIQIHTVEEEMRYDVPYFVVEAGRSVQVVLKNEDLMGHNLVVTTPGSLQEVAELGLAAGPKGDKRGRQYVPDSDKVLFATNLVGSGKEERLTFNAPTELGEYPYVCTFPRHWMRMYGVMLVVEDLDAWQQNPKPPADPLGIERAFVQEWALSDFSSVDFADASSSRGKEWFTEATCVLCHQANGVGGQVGPALNGVFERWKGNHGDVLREILEPSHRIDPKYAVHLIVTDEGESFTGIVAEEDKQTISIRANPESKELDVIEKDSIEEMVKTSTSMMPKGLLNRYTREEVLDLLKFLAELKE